MIFLQFAVTHGRYGQGQVRLAHHAWRTFDIVTAIVVRPVGFRTSVVGITKFNAFRVRRKDCCQTG